MKVQEANYLLKHFSREELTSVDMFGLDWLTQCVYQDNFPVAKLLVENGFDKARACSFAHSTGRISWFIFFQQRRRPDG
jgi:hypothetical protein